MARAIRWSLGAVAAALIVAAILLATGTVAVPPRYDPFTPLDIGGEPSFLISYKLTRLKRDNAACLAALGTSAMSFAPLPDHMTQDGCGTRGAVTVRRSEVAFSAPFAASCPLAAAWALFERHTLNPAAVRHFGHKVSQVTHLGSYNCRAIGHGGSRLSEHATANAIDVTGFVLANGRRIAIAKEWDGESSPRRAFLRALRDGGCRFFDAVLGPDFNNDHRNHFHFDMGRVRACR
jgi:hypothetical protein